MTSTDTGTLDLTQYGYAFGGYIGKPCTDCAETFIAAKRAWRCKPCALTLAVKESRAEAEDLRANINTKAAFIEATIDQLAESDERIDALNKRVNAADAVVEAFTDFNSRWLAARERMSHAEAVNVAIAAYRATENGTANPHLAQAIAKSRKMFGEETLTDDDLAAYCATQAPDGGSA